MNKQKFNELGLGIQIALKVDAKQIFAYLLVKTQTVYRDYHYELYATHFLNKCIALELLNDNTTTESDEFLDAVRYIANS